MELKSSATPTNACTNHEKNLRCLEIILLIEYLSCSISGDHRRRTSMRHYDASHCLTNWTIMVGKEQINKHMLA